MLTYLFDASAAVELYAPRNQRSCKVVAYIAAQRTVHRKATLLIPNFCIAEVFNTLARMRFRPSNRDQALTQGEYKTCLRNFRDDIRWGKALYAYELNRYHVLAADKIILAEHILAPQEEKSHLSTYDILVIAMACELAYVSEPDKVFLVTWDRRMRTVCEELKKMDPKKLKPYEVERDMGEPDERRWMPPKVLYVPEITPHEVEPVPGQSPLNF